MGDCKPCPVSKPDPSPEVIADLKRQLDEAAKVRAELQQKLFNLVWADFEQWCHERRAVADQLIPLSELNNA